MAGTRSPLEDIELLAHVSQLLASSDVENILLQTVQIAIKITESSLGSLLIRDGQRWRLISPTPMSEEKETRIAAKLIESGMSGWTYRNNEPLVINNVDNDSRWLRTDANPDARSALAIPINFRDQRMGVLTLTHPVGDHYTPYHVRLAAIVANQAATALHNAHALYQVQAQERQMRAILQAVPDILLVLDAAGRVVLHSYATVQLLDGLTAEYLDGRSINELVEIDQVFLPVTKIVRGSVPEYGEWSMEVRSEKRNRDYLMNVSVWDVFGDAGYVVVMNDITTLRDLTRFKDNMMNLTLHDLASPLNLVLNSASMLLDDVGQQQYESAEYFARNMLQSAQRMQALIDKMRLLERIRSSPLEMMEGVDLHRIADDTVNEHLQQAQVKNIDLQSFISVAQQTMIFGNGVMLKQAMENLVSNAIKYTRKNGVVQVRAYAEDNHFYFEVTDSGIGIPVEDIERIFDPFFRARNANAVEKGTGLGLNLVRTIIEQHGGSVGVESEAGVGSRFWFVLPI